MKIAGYVIQADTNDIKVIVTDKRVEKILREYGFKKNENNELVYASDGEEEKAIAFNLLNKNNIAFSAGREWCPSEVFEYLREKGLVIGSYRRIAWVNPHETTLTIEQF